jgi:ABC-type histidine transport system ATPase subunit
VTPAGNQDTAKQGAEERDGIIVVRELHKWFGDFHVLRGISMQIYEGEKMVIFGWPSRA